MPKAGGGVQNFLKINKQGGANNFRGGQNIPENCTYLQKSAFLKFQNQKINKRGSLSEAAAEGGSVAMAERNLTNAFVVQWGGSKIIFSIVANLSAIMVHIRL